MGEMIAVTAVRTEDAPWMADTIVRYAREHGVEASPVDEFRLDDAWVFVDFWRRLGITVPDGDVPLRRIRLDAEALPEDGPDLDGHAAVVAGGLLLAGRGPGSPLPWRCRAPRRRRAERWRVWARSRDGIGTAGLLDWTAWNGSPRVRE
jgi:hypothetical protein